MKYLIWSNEHGQWWKPNSMGYTRVLDLAGTYTAMEALDIVSKAVRGGMVTREDFECSPELVVAWGNDED